MGLTPRGDQQHPTALPLFYAKRRVRRADKPAERDGRLSEAKA